MRRGVLNSPPLPQRDHVPAEDRYPLYNGDSIGLWDGNRLVVHTNQLQGGIYQRSNPDYTDQVETVEKAGKVTTWGFEAKGPSTPARAGIRPSDLKPGTRIPITSNPMKDGRPAAIWVNAVRADGKTFNPRAGFAVR